MLEKVWFLSLWAMWSEVVSLPMRLHLMSDKGLQGMGAVCLDGSDAAFYFAPAADPEFANTWEIHFQGGGWCYDEIDCWHRSVVQGLGTTKGLQPVVSEGGLMSDDCDSNPDFCNANRVHIVYCDGNSFSGNRDQPLLVTGLDGKQKPIYFRGKRIIDATLQTLLTMGLDKAQNVLLSGCSAGGLSTFLHADYVNAWLQKAQVPLLKFRAAPMSGFFLLHNTVEGKPVYPEQMQYIFNMANSTHGLNHRCIAAKAQEDRWTCNFAEMSYNFTQAPMFVLNSALDGWQTGCIYTAELASGFPNQKDISNGNCWAAAGWKSCAKDPETCDSGQMSAMNQYLSDFQSTLQNKVAYDKTGNGAFIHSCHTHCESLLPSWNTIAVNGVTMQEAFSRWWHSDGEPAAQHSYTSCLYSTTTRPRQCNPTCQAGDENVVIV